MLWRSTQGRQAAAGGGLFVMRLLMRLGFMIAGLAACGGLSSGATVGPVEVTIATGPETSSAHVFLSDAQGQLLGEGDPNEAGRFEMDVPYAAQLTVVHVRASGTTQVETIVGVQPGDSLHFGAAARAEDAINTSVSVELPGGVDGATHYWTGDGCSHQVDDSPSAATLAVTSRCVDPEGYFTVVAVAYDDKSGRALAYATGRGQFGITGAPAIAPLATWRFDFARLDMKLVNAPQGAEVLWNTAFVRERGTTFTVAPGERSYAVKAGQGLARTFDLVPGFGETLAYTVAVGTGNGFSAMITSLTTLPSAVSVDLTDELLAPVEKVEVSYDALARLNIAWSPSAPTALGDWVYASVRSQQTTWNVLAPPGTLNIVLPELGDFGVSIGSDTGVVPDLQKLGVVDLSHIDSYEAVKPEFFGTGVAIPPTGYTLRYLEAYR